MRPIKTGDYFLINGELFKLKFISNTQDYLYFLNKNTGYSIPFEAYYEYAKHFIHLYDNKLSRKLYDIS